MTSDRKESTMDADVLERMHDKLRATVMGQTNDPEHLLNVLIAAWEEMHREVKQRRVITDEMIERGAAAIREVQIPCGERALAEDVLRAALEAPDVQ